MAHVLPEFSEPTDRFLLQDRAGAGGMGDVFRATDQESGAIVAVKVLRASAGAVERRRFQREIAVIADLRHPNIVEYVAHGTLPDHRLFYAMEWLEGEDLGQRQRHTPLGMRDAVEVIRRSAAAMAAVHARGIVHRDLKLGNIFLVRGKGTAIKLIDFGVVRLPEAEPVDDRGSIIGTPHFMAPEQARGENVDARADVYSLGSALFRLITGRNVFETEHVIALLGRLVLEDPPNPMSLRFDVPETLDRVVLQALARNREERFENGGELARALARIGDVSNDPPATDRSASAIRRAIPALAALGPESEQERRRKTARRVVAAVAFRLGANPIPAEVERELRAMIGDDARIEALYGGQVVAILGVERSRGDEPLRAARAALYVTKEMPETSAVVAVGHAVLSATPGDGGHPAGGNLAGEALERAAKQLDIAAPGTVRVDTNVTAALSGRFVMSEDKHGAVLVREDQSGFGARLLLGAVTPTVGRDKEIALLTSVFSELLDEGTPRAALVIGPPGIGKSRVRTELVSRLETSAFPPEVLFCRGDPMSQGSSLSSFGRAMRQVIGIHDGETPEEQVEKVRQHMNFRMPKPLRFLSGFLAELVGVPFPDESDEPLRAARQNLALMQSRMRMAIEAFVRAQAEIMPQVMFLEDAHWADETTIDLVDWLLGCPDVKFAVFAFARPELSTRLPTLWNNKTVTRLSLAPLSPLAADKLVARALPAVEARTRSSIVERAGGNALFLEELIRSKARGEDELPLTVQALVQMRLDRLSPGLRETVRAASVLGQTFWTGAVSGLIERDATAELDELESNEMIQKQGTSRVAGETEWAFRQAVVRDAAYASILEEDRTAWHVEAGAWLESRGDADVGLLARHADAGRNFERAAELYARATRQAYANGAHLETALELAERGLACGGAEGGIKAQLLLAAAQARIPLGRLDDGVRAAEQAAELSIQGSDMWAEAQRLAAQALIENGKALEGDARAARALSKEFVGSLSYPMRVALLAGRVRGLVDLQEPKEALRVADEALSLAREVNSNEALLKALEARLFALMQLADPSEVVFSGPQVIEIADQVGDVVLSVRARINTASSMNALGFWEDARILLERSLVDARDRRMRILEAFSLHNLGMCEARLGHFDRGIKMEQDASKIADETGAARLRIHARVYEVMFTLWRADAVRKSNADVSHEVKAALAICATVAEAVKAVPALLPTARFVVAVSELARARSGDPSALEPAMIAALEAHNNALQTPVEEWEEATHLTLVDAFIALGDQPNADHALETAFRVIVERSERMTRAGHRASYLERIPEVVRIQELAKARLGKEVTSTTGATRLPTMRPTPPPPSVRKPTGLGASQPPPLSMSGSRSSEGERDTQVEPLPEEALRLVPAQPSAPPVSSPRSIEDSKATEPPPPPASARDTALPRPPPVARVPLIAAPTVPQAPASVPRRRPPSVPPQSGGAPVSTPSTQARTQLKPPPLPSAPRTTVPGAAPPPSARFGASAPPSRSGAQARLQPSPPRPPIAPVPPRPPSGAAPPLKGGSSGQPPPLPSSSPPARSAAHRSTMPPPLPPTPPIAPQRPTPPVPPPRPQAPTPPSVPAPSDSVAGSVAPAGQTDPPTSSDVAAFVPPRLRYAAPMPPLPPKPPRTPPRPKKS